MRTATIALGSNLGDRVSLMRRAVAAVSALPGVEGVRCSRLYETPAVGFDGVGAATGQGAFLNAAARLDTTLGPRELLDALLLIEAALGRVERNKREKWSARPIDLDLLTFNDAVIDEPGMTVPHPGIAARWFVLKPLCDVAPDAKHPVLNRTMRELLEAVEAFDDKNTGKGVLFEDASIDPV